MPAFFNDQQRAATLRAAGHAGFKMCKLINESSAFAVCYFYDYKKFEKDEYYLVYDLGGGTFDAAICRPTCEVFYSIAANCCFGGYDFDFAILRQLVNSLRKLSGFNANWLADKVILRHLQIEAQKIKENLSFCDEYTVCFKNFLPRYIHDLTITRGDFEKMVDPLLHTTIAIVDNFLKEANIPKFVIKKVLLVGGLAKIPIIQHLLTQYFGRNIIEDCSNSCYVAQGAALCARKFLRRSLASRNRPVFYVTSVCIAIRLSIIDVMVVVIEKNSSLPCIQTISIATLRLMENNFQFDIYETEGLISVDNTYLTTVKVRYMTATIPDKSELVVELAIDVVGMITVSAKRNMYGPNKCSIFGI